MQLVQQSPGGPADDSVRSRLLLRLRVALGRPAEQLPREMPADLRQGAEPRPAAEEPHPEVGDQMWQPREGLRCGGEAAASGRARRDVRVLPGQVQEPGVQRGGQPAGHGRSHARDVRLQTGGAVRERLRADAHPQGADAERPLLPESPEGAQRRAAVQDDEPGPRVQEAGD